MNAKTIVVAVAMLAAGFVGAASAASAASLACSVTDESNPHFFDAFSNVGVGSSQGEVVGGGVTLAFSANNPPCDQVGSDGDNEQGISGAQMPIALATCPYSQDIANEQAGGGPVTVGHHGDDIFVTNTAGIDVTWTSGVDGQDPAATLAGQTCTGNGVISNDPTTDPADCSDSTGANVNLLGNEHVDTDPISIGTNDPNSGFTCLDAVDGNEWTFLNTGPFLGTSGCPSVLNGELGFSLPLTGTIASGVEAGEPSPACAFPQGFFGFHALTVGGTTAYFITALTPGWSCFDSNGNPVPPEAVLPTPFLQCLPPNPGPGVINECSDVGNHGYGAATGGTLTVTTACSGGLSASKTIPLPSGFVADHASGLSALAYVTCSATENAIPPPVDWWIGCTVNMPE
jgi:hypothetical protein